MTAYADDIAALDDDPLAGSPEQPGEPDQELLKTALEQLAKEIDLLGKEERIWQLAEIQRCLMLWHGESSLYWNDAARSWQSIWDAYEQGLVDEEDVDDYDRDINFYRPMLESIIAAATVEVPRIHFTPARPSDPQDLITAREATKISTYLDVVNDAKKLLHEAHFVLANQHFVAGYTYYESDASKYGVETEDIMGPVEKTDYIDMCPNCGSDITEQPDMGGVKPCPLCGQMVPPQPDMQTSLVDDVVGQNVTPKSKICIEVYGPRNIKLPYYVKEFAASPYLDFSMEQSVALLAEIYKEKADEILALGSTSNDKYDRWVREPVTSIGGGKRDQATHRRLWFRPWAFNYIADKNDRVMVRNAYPNGALAIFVNDLFIKCVDSSMDEHWEISETAFAETIHDDPGGKILIPINEMQNDILQLWNENIKQNIPEVYVDAQLFDLEQYKKIMARPGMRTPVKRPPGQAVSSGIHETRAVTISQESMELYHIAEQLAQFTSGAMPSIFGGFLQAGSKTAFEYDASRQAALQRVALKLANVNSWWAKLKFKAVELYRQNAVKTTEFAARSGTSYKPIIIDPDNLKGGLDQALPESSSAFPTAWSQKRDFAVQCLQSGNEHMIQLFFHPENSTLLKELIGIPELFIPGEQDRMKQLWEISELLKEAPIQVPMMGQAGPTMGDRPSIMPDPKTDNGPAHIITLQNWLNSDDGREAQKNNPQGYANVIAHLTAHLMLMPPPQPAGPGDGSGAPGDVPPPSGGQ